MIRKLEGYLVIFILLSLYTLVESLDQYWK